MSKPSDFSLSFEVFPSRDATQKQSLSRCVAQLSAYQPAYVSVTQGALGADAQYTRQSVLDLHKARLAPIASHITAGFADKAGVLRYAEALAEQGIDRLIALRGDAAASGAEVFDSALSLVEGLKQAGNFDISVAAYPETHPKAQSAAADIQVLKAKLDAGAQRAITQLFFEPETFLRFRDQARQAGIDKPIIAGILPITDFARTVRFAKRCGARVPESYHQYFEGTEGAYSPVQQVLGVDLATELCQRLLDEGVDGLHFYTLNRAEASAAVLEALGLSTLKDSASSLALAKAS